MTREAVAKDNGMTTNVIQHRIEGYYRSLRASERKVAKVILADPEAALYLSIDELADRAKTSKTTVLRFAKAIGYAGFADFKVDLARNMPSSQSNLFQQLGNVHSVIELGQSLLEIDMRTLQATLSLIEPEVFERTVQAIREARYVHLYGVGASGLVALDAQHKLQRVQIPAWSFADPHLQMSGAAQLGPSDVVIPISYSGVTPDIVDSARIASERGAYVVAITGNQRSVLASIANDVLLVGSTETAWFSGAVATRLGELFLIDLLSLAVAQTKKEETTEYLERMTKIVAARRK